MRDTCEQLFSEYAKKVDDRLDNFVYMNDLYTTSCDVPALSIPECLLLQRMLRLQYGYHDDSFFPIEPYGNGLYHFSVMKKYYYRVR